MIIYIFFCGIERFNECKGSLWIQLCHLKKYYFKSVSRVGKKHLVWFIILFMTTLYLSINQKKIVFIFWMCLAWMLASYAFQMLSKKPERKYLKKCLSLDSQIHCNTFYTVYIKSGFIGDIKPTSWGETLWHPSRNEFKPKNWNILTDTESRADEGRHRETCGDRKDTERN